MIQERGCRPGTQRSGTQYGTHGIGSEKSFEIGKEITKGGSLLTRPPIAHSSKRTEKSPTLSGECEIFLELPSWRNRPERPSLSNLHMPADTGFPLTLAHVQSAPVFLLLAGVKPWLARENPVCLMHPHGFYVALLHFTEAEEWRFHTWPKGTRNVLGMSAFIHTHDRNVESGSWKANSQYSLRCEGSYVRGATALHCLVRWGSL